MPRGKYKRYRDPESVAGVPRSTLYDRRRRNNQLLADAVSVAKNIY